MGGDLCMYVCRKVKNSQARTGHQRGMGGRWTDDDDTHERHTDTNKLTRHTASGLPHTLSRQTHNSRPHPPCRPPQHPTVPRVQTRAQRHNRRQEVTCEARAGLLYLQQSHRPARHGRDRMWGLVRCLRTPSSRASCLRLALSRTHSTQAMTIKCMSVCKQRRVC